MEKSEEAVSIDVFLIQVTYLPFNDVVNICQTNKFYHSYCTEYNIRWKNLIYNTFGHLYGYKDILNRLWKKLGYNENKDTYNYIVYTKFVELLDPITQLMIYHKQKDKVSFNDKKFNNTQRFLAMVLLGSKVEMNKYLPEWVEGNELKTNLNMMLIKMSKYGNPLGVKLLLEKGADIHAREDNALRWASKYGRTEAVKLLLEEGADIHVHNDFALITASFYGHKDIVVLLLKYGADVHADNDEALREASINGDTEIIKLLLEEGADIHAKDDEALRSASYYGQTEIVKLLLEEGADIHADNDYALRLASKKGHTETTILLLKYGADITEL